MSVVIVIGSYLWGVERVVGPFDHPTAAEDWLRAHPVDEGQSVKIVDIERGE